MNLQTIAELEDEVPGLELIFVECEEANLARTFNAKLVGCWI